MKSTYKQIQEIIQQVKSDEEHKYIFTEYYTSTRVSRVSELLTYNTINVDEETEDLDDYELIDWAIVTPEEYENTINSDGISYSEDDVLVFLVKLIE